MNARTNFCPLCLLCFWLQKQALIVKGPTDVRKRELIFLQFHQNETEQDFSAIGYLLFFSYQEFSDR